MTFALVIVNSIVMGIVILIGMLIVIPMVMVILTLTEISIVIPRLRGSQLLHRRRDLSHFAAAQLQLALPAGDHHDDNLLIIYMWIILVTYGICGEKIDLTELEKSEMSPHDIRNLVLWQFTLCCCTFVWRKMSYMK